MLLTWTRRLCFYLLHDKRRGKTTTKIQHPITIPQSTTLTGAGLDVETSLPFINWLLILVVGPYEPFPNSYEAFIHQTSRKQLQQQLLVTSNSVIKGSLWMQWLWGIRQLNFNHTEMKVSRFWVPLFVFHISHRKSLPHVMMLSLMLNFIHAFFPHHCHHLFHSALLFLLSDSSFYFSHSSSWTKAIH